MGSIRNMVVLNNRIRGLAQQNGWKIDEMWLVYDYCVIRLCKNVYIFKKIHTCHKK